MTKPIEQRVMDRLLAKHQAIRTELTRLKKSYEGSVSLRCQSLNDQCDLLEEILGVPRSFPRRAVGGDLVGYLHTPNRPRLGQQVTLQDRRHRSNWRAGIESDFEIVCIQGKELTVEEVEET